MRKASRLFEIIQILRLARHPITAQAIADRLEVTVRSIYRDIVALQAMRVPIEGERGIGYILRPGFDMPPLMLTAEEIEAVMLGMAMIGRTPDRALVKAAGQVLDKLSAALPPPLRQALAGRTLMAWGGTPMAPENALFTTLREAIRDERVLLVRYRDGENRETERCLRPIALIYYPDGVNVVAWCELRTAIRNFRLDRIDACQPLERHFRGEGEALRQSWVAGWQAS